MDHWKLFLQYLSQGREGGGGGLHVQIKPPLSVSSINSSWVFTGPCEVLEADIFVLWF